MLRINDVHSIKLIMQAAQVQYVPEWHYAIADYDKGDCIKGGVIYTEYWGGSVMMHTAGFQRNWVSKALLWIAFDYPFDKLGVNKVFAPVPEWNWRSRNFCLHLGFKPECKMSDVFSREDGVNGMDILAMYKKDCRWVTMPRPELKFALPNQMSQPTIH